MRHIFDLDGTLCETEGTDYENAKPIQDRIDYVNQLFAEGHHIIIDTARGTGSGISKTDITMEQLRHWGLNHHELRCGSKPYGDVYVDDKAIPADVFFRGGMPPSPIDNRDWGSRELGIRWKFFYPSVFFAGRMSFEEIKKMFFVRNQRNVGNCVSFASVAIMEYHLKRLTGAPTILAPGFIYANRDADDWQGRGMYPREALASLKRDGVPLYEYFPYESEYGIAKRFMPEAYSEAFESASFNRIKAYGRLRKHWEIKSALMQLGPVLAVLKSTESFKRLDGFVYRRYTDEKSSGQHAFVIVGWDETGYIGLNSYGKDFGESGFFKIPYDMFGDISEVWGVKVF